MRALALAWLAVLVTATAAAAADAPRIDVVSNRADVISGGDALVRITRADGSPATGAEVRAGARDVGSAFALRENGAYEGLLTGLTVGENLVTATVDGVTARLTIDNHPIGGPIFAGKQVQPWVCNTQSPPANSGTSPTVVPVGLGLPQDAQCNTPAAVSYAYRSVATGSFEAYDPAAPPQAAQIATTTTDQGVTVPYIVRQEFGVQDRGIYAMAVLADPAKPWAPWAPQKTWNGKLLMYFGASTAPNHLQSQPSAVLDHAALSRGFMTANSSLGVHGQNSNENVGAEASIMLKEHIAERFGPIRYTIGEGCSGGSYQTMYTNMYPGLLDGIQPNCSYTDLWTTAPDVIDCRLLIAYFEANPNQPWVPEIDGHKDPSDCAVWDALFGGALDPTNEGNCKLAADQVYDPQTNPSAVRCTLQDYQEGLFGLRAAADWGPVERKIGRGFAEKPWGNLGVQYGLEALESGAITAAQFADLNAKIGSQDIDGVRQAARTAVNEKTAAIMYRTAQVTDGSQLDRVPIIDLRAYSETGEIHTSFYSYKMRARLDKANGHHDNHLIWTFPAAEPILGVSPPADLRVRSLLLIDEWLGKIEADKRDLPLERKVVLNKPADATDKCFTQPASATPANPSPDVGTEVPSAQCALLYPYYGNTRTAAGAPLTDDVIQCRLKPLSKSDYSVTFSDAQWAQLLQAFPTGVCDWSKPGLGEQPSIPWITFADGPGGRPLGDPPRSAAVEAPAAPACAVTGAFQSVAVTPLSGGRLRVSFARRATGAVVVDVVGQSRGRRISRDRLVARFRGVVRPFTWDGRVRGRRVADGVYVVRLRLGTETRRLAVRRVRGRFQRLGSFERSPGCGLLSAFRLERPVFGGPGRASLGVRYRLNADARVRLHVVQGRRVVRRVAVRTRRAGVAYRLRLPADAIPRGDVHVRITAVGTGRTSTATLTARRL